MGCGRPGGADGQLPGTRDDERELRQGHGATGGFRRARCPGQQPTLQAPQGLNPGLPPEGPVRSVEDRRDCDAGGSTACDNSDNLQAIAGPDLSVGELGRGDGLAVEFDDDAAWRQPLGTKELLQRTGQLRFHRLAVGDHGWHPLFTYAVRSGPWQVAGRAGGSGGRSFQLRRGTVPVGGLRRDQDAAGPAEGACPPVSSHRRAFSATVP